MESYHPRPFTAWASAREDDSRPSLWARLRGRIARLFGRRRAEESEETMHANVLASENVHHSDELNAIAREAAQRIDDLTADPVTPPSDFKFPWTQSDSDLPLIEGTFDSVDAALPRAEKPSRGEPLDDFDAFAEAETDPVPKADAEPTPKLVEPDATQEVPRPPGLIARLLRRRKEVAVEERTETEKPSAEINPTFLVSKFRSFYNEILTQKHQGSDITSGFATAILPQDSHDNLPGVTADQAAESLSVRLLQMLELQHAEATWMGGETAARYPEAQYAMAVLADETLSTLEWKGRSAWPQHSLEMKLYKSHAADLEFFRRVDRLFKERDPSPVARDLARVYLLTVAAGFRGKYGVFGLTRALHEYRQRLYEFVYDGDALMLYADDRKLFADATSRTIAGKPIARFSGAQRWVAVLVAVLIGYTVLAHLAWNRASADLRDVTARVEATNESGAR
jgi:type VI secretion system protein ImpK